ncbi:MAG TPA: prenyltransferase/squalene oxidase repeat-containing protein [Isosphaeraceae bacterium]|nr:prenyltransferase/squalene oxidase repeat-containing protein [Isosphaeraceae bacterium]
MERGWPVIAVGRRLRRRWAQLRHGEYDAATLRSVPSWGLSVLLHLLLLLILALMVRFGRGSAQSEPTIQAAVVDTQLGEITSLVDAQRSGDPFTKADSLDPPSLGLDPADSPLKLVGQPEVSSLQHYAPDFAGPAPLTDIQGASMAAIRLPELAATVMAPFSGRQGLTRARLVQREGGTARSEKSVEDGLAWIVRHQREDGSWSLNFHSQCKGVGCTPQRAMESDTAATGLALLPLLGAGYIHTVKSRHQDAVRRGLFWLVNHQQPDGNLFIGPSGMAFMYSHAIGTMALCEAYGLSQDPRLKKPAQRAIQFIINAQNPVTGGWRYSPGQEGDTSVFGWEIFALRSGHIAGIKIPRGVLKGCSRYLDSAAADSHRTTYSYQPGRPLTPVMTSEALLSRQLLGWPRNYPPLIKGAAQVAAHLDLAPERNIYYWYYATQLLHNMENKDWERWNLKVRENLIRMQVQEESCAQGSWDPELPAPDRWALVAGRLYLTSLSILTLEVYYRYLPLYRGYDDDQGKGEPAMGGDDGKEDEPAATGVGTPAAGVPKRPRAG